MSYDNNDNNNGNYDFELNVTVVGTLDTFIGLFMKISRIHVEAAIFCNINRFYAHTTNY